MFVLFNRPFPRDRDPLPLGLARPLLGVEAGEVLFVIVHSNAKAADLSVRHVCSRGDELGVWRPSQARSGRGVASGRRSAARGRASSRSIPAPSRSSPHHCTPSCLVSATAAAILCRSQPIYICGCDLRRSLEIRTRRFLQMTTPTTTYLYGGESRGYLHDLHDSRINFGSSMSSVLSPRSNNG